MNITERSAFQHTLKFMSVAVET